MIALERTRLRQGTSGGPWIDTVGWKTSGCAQMDTVRSETSDRARKDLMEVGPSSCTRIDTVGYRDKPVRLGRAWWRRGTNSCASMDTDWVRDERSGSKGPGGGRTEQLRPN